MAEQIQITLTAHIYLGLTSSTGRDSSGVAHRLLTRCGFSTEHPYFAYALGRTDLEGVWDALGQLHESVAAHSISAATQPFFCTAGFGWMMASTAADKFRTRHSD